MVQEGLSLGIAFVGGLVAFFSPCHVPLFPVYLAFLAGSASAGEEKSDQWKTMVNSWHFVAGFSAVFVLLGLAAGWFAAALSAYQGILQRLAGLLLIFFGLYLSGVFTPAFLQRERRVAFAPKRVGPGTAMLMGMAFAAGWTPCVGPVLGSILVYAAAAGDGAYLLAAFSAGMAVPYLLAAVLVDRITRLISSFRAYLPLVQRIFGIILVLLGAAVFFGLLNRLALFIM